MLEKDKGLKLLSLRQDDNNNSQYKRVISKFIGSLPKRP